VGDHQPEVAIEQPQTGEEARGRGGPSES
jgi:hypothetical protein